MTMRKEAVDLSIGSWLCSIQVDSSSDVQHRLYVNHLEMINMILGGMQVPNSKFKYFMNRMKKGIETRIKVIR